MIELVPAGYKHILILVALVKRALLTPGIKPADKLYFLEGLENLTDNYIQPEMLAMIEPMGDNACAIVAEAKSLDPAGDKSGKASFAVLSSERVFGHFLALNPSICKAIEWREANRGRTVATASTRDTVPPPSAPLPMQPAAPSPYGYEIPDRFVQPR